MAFNTSCYAKKKNHSMIQWVALLNSSPFINTYFINYRYSILQGGRLAICECFHSLKNNSLQMMAELVVDHHIIIMESIF